MGEITILADTHTHTNCSDHAFGTLCENIHYGKQNGMKLICMTNHAPAIPDSAHIWHFVTMHELPKVIEGVRVLCGCEANITDESGKLDLDEDNLRKMEIVIASIHRPCFEAHGAKDFTDTWLEVIKNPYVNILGHSGNPLFPYDRDTVIKAAKENNKCIEINNHSYSVRAGSRENCREIALKCKEVGCPIVVGSDAHTPFDVGNFGKAVEMLEEISFPPELIMNRTPERLIEYLREEGKNV